MASLFDIFKSDETLLAEKRAKLDAIKQIIDEADPAISGYVQKWGSKADPEIAKTWDRIKLLSDYKYNSISGKKLGPPLEPPAITPKVPPSPTKQEVSLGSMIPKPAVVPEEGKMGDPWAAGMQRALATPAGAFRLMPSIAAALGQSYETTHPGSGMGRVGLKIAEKIEPKAKEYANIFEEIAAKTYPAKPPTGKYAKPPKSTIDYIIDPKRAWMTLGQNVPQLGTFAVSNAINPAFGFLTMMAAEGGDSAKNIEDYEKENGPIDPNVKYSIPLVVGAVNAELEQIGLGEITETLKIPGLKAKIVQALLGTIVEGSQEGLQEIVQILGERGYKKEAFVLKEYWPRVVDSAYGGLLLGAAGGAGSVAFGNIEQQTPPPVQPGVPPAGPTTAPPPGAGVPPPGTAPPPPGQEIKPPFPAVFPPVGQPGVPPAGQETTPIEQAKQLSPAQLQQRIEAALKKAKEKKIKKPVTKKAKVPNAETIRSDEGQIRPAGIIPGRGTIEGGENIQLPAEEEAIHAQTVKQKAQKTLSLRGWVRKAGGILPESLREYGINPKEDKKLYTLLVKKNGLGADDLAKQAIAEGVLPPSPGDINTSDWLIQHLRGKRGLSVSAQLRQEMKRGAGELEGALNIARKRWGDIEPQTPRPEHAGDLAPGTIVSHEGDVFRVEEQTGAGARMKDGHEVIMEPWDEANVIGKGKAPEKRQKKEFTAEDMVLKPEAMKDIQEIAIWSEGKIYSSPQGENEIYNHSDLAMKNVPKDKLNDIIPGFINKNGDFVDNQLKPLYLSDDVLKMRGKTGEEVGKIPEETTPAPTIDRVQQIKSELNRLEKQYQKQMIGGPRDAMIPPPVKKSALDGIVKKMDRLEKELETIEKPAPTAAEEIRWPWQMTKEEFFAQPHHGRDVRFQGDQFHRESVKEAIELGRPVPENVLAEYPDLKPATKEPWEMTREEFIKRSKERLAKKGHKYGKGDLSEHGFEIKAGVAHELSVKDAVKNKKISVPPAVLAEYPDLAPKPEEAKPEVKHELVTKYGYTVTKDIADKIPKNLIPDENGTMNQRSMQYRKVQDWMQKELDAIGNPEGTGYSPGKGLFEPEVKPEEVKSESAEKEGKPVELTGYHGTFETFDKFDKSKLGSATGAPSAKLGFFFSSNKDVATGYASEQSQKVKGLFKTIDKHTKRIEELTGGTITEANFKIVQQELYNRPSGWDNHLFVIIKNLSKKIQAAQDQLQGIEEMGAFSDIRQARGGKVKEVKLKMENPFIYDYEGNTSRIEKYADLITFAKRKGHDGVIFKNTYDPAVPVGGADNLTDVYVVFDESQIITGEKPEPIPAQVEKPVLTKDELKAKGYDVSNPYNEAVAKNLEYMGTKRDEWTATPVRGMAETEDDLGRTVSMPEFEFPKGYDPAPTLYPSSSAQSFCGLCGKPIKNIYWIQNDDKKWTLSVGSECVTHFGEVSGKELVAEFTRGQTREFFKEAKDIKHKLYQQFTEKRHAGYGRYEMHWTKKEAKELYEILKKRTQNIIVEKEKGSALEPTGDQALAAAMTRAGDELKDTVKRAKEILGIPKVEKQVEKPVEKISEIGKGMARAISDNLRTMLRNNVEATGKLPQQERNSLIGKVYEKLVEERGASRSPFTLDHALELVEMAENDPLKMVDVWNREVMHIEKPISISKDALRKRNQSMMTQAETLGDTDTYKNLLSIFKTYQPEPETNVKSMENYQAALDNLQKKMDEKFPLGEGIKTRIEKTAAGDQITPLELRPQAEMPKGKIGKVSAPIEGRGGVGMFGTEEKIEQESLFGEEVGRATLSKETLWLMEDVGDPAYIAGDKYADLRRMIIKDLTKQDLPKSKTPMNVVRMEMIKAASINPSGKTLNAVDNEIRKWVKDQLNKLTGKVSEELQEYPSHISFQEIAKNDWTNPLLGTRTDLELERRMKDDYSRYLYGKGIDKIEKEGDELKLYTIYKKVWRDGEHGQMHRPVFEEKFTDEELAIMFDKSGPLINEHFPRLPGQAKSKPYKIKYKKKKPEAIQNPTALTDEDVDTKPPFPTSSVKENYDMGGYSDSGPYHPNYRPSMIKLPELVRIARELLGKFPTVKRWITPLGAKGKFIHNDIEATIEILADLAKGNLVVEKPFNKKGDFDRDAFAKEVADELGIDPDELVITFGYNKRTGKWTAKAFKPDPTLICKVLAHEIGHANDWMPEHTMKRGNVLGKIASLKDYFKHLLPEYFGSPNGILTERDRERLRKEARALLSGTKIIQIDVLIKSELKVTPDEILAIWNTFAARETDPELYRYMAGLSTAQKKLALIDAMKGIVSDWIEFKRIVVEYKKETRVISGETRDEEIRKMYQQLLREEINKRKLFDLNTIRKELKKLTQIWKPFPEDADPDYTKYRYSGEELYADAISILLNDPGLMDAHAPTFKTALFNYLDRKPEFKKVYEEIQNLIAGPDDALFERRYFEVQESYDEMNKEMLDAFQHEERPSIWRDIRKGLIDYREDLLAKKREALKKGTVIDPEYDPEYWTEQLPYIQSQIFQYYRDMDNDVAQLLKAEDIPDGDLGFSLMLRRTATERKYFANPWGYNEAESKKDLNLHLKKLGQDKAAALNTAISNFYKIRDTKVIPLLKESGMLSEELLKYIEEHDNYVTFQVAEYLKEKLGEQGVGKVYKEINATTSKIYRQYGTFKSIANPFHTTLLKDAALMRAAVRTMAAKNAAKFMQDNFPDEIKVIPKTWDGQLKLKEAPPGTTPLLWMQNGKLSGVFMPKGIVDIFEYRFNDFKGLQKYWNYIVRPFKELFVGKNIPWSLWNMRRDFRKTLLELPAETKVGKLELFKTMMRSIPDAYKDVFKNFSTDIVRRMYESRALILGRNWSATVEDEETVFDFILKQNGMDDVHYKNTMVRLLSKLWDALEKPGKFSERLMKITGAKILEKHGITGERAGHLIRTRMGSPDFYRRGSAFNLYNNAFLFSNAGKEGWRSALEAAKESPATFFYKVALYDIAPKMAMRACELGVFAYMAAAAFGPDDWRTHLFRKQQELMRKIPNRDKMNYMVLPVAETKAGKAVYICLPHDFTAQVIAGVAWQLTKGFTDTEISSLFDYIQGGIPYSGISPPISMIMDTGLMLAGKNPYDSFGGKQLIADEKFKAGAKIRWKEFAKQEWNRYGGSYLYRFPYDDLDKIKGNIETALDIPLAGPLLRRAIRVSDRGAYEQIEADLKTDDELRYQEGYEINAKIVEHLNKKNIAPGQRDAKKLYMELKEEGLDVKRFSDFYRRYQNKSTFQQNDALSISLRRAVTNEQKVIVYNKLLGLNISEKELKLADEYAKLNRLKRQGKLEDKDKSRYNALEIKLKGK